MNFAEKLQNLRKKNNLSQEALAEKLSVSRQSVSKWELGLSYPETDKIILISELFRVTIDYLLKDADKSETINKNESDLQEVNFSNSKIDHKYKITVCTCSFFFGIIGIFSLWILSTMNPVYITPEDSNADIKYFGFAKFLLAHNALYLFFFCCLVSLISLLLLLQNRWNFYNLRIKIGLNIIIWSTLCFLISLAATPVLIQWPSDKHALYSTPLQFILLMIFASTILIGIFISFIFKSAINFINKKFIFGKHKV